MNATGTRFVRTVQSALHARASRRSAAPASPPESPLVRRTRWRLIAWSGGTTLIVLLVLGVAIYVAAARSLADAGVDQLRSRVSELVTNKPMTVTTNLPIGGSANVGLQVTSDPSNVGVVIGGAASGTVAFFVPFNAFDRPIQPLGGGTPASLVGDEATIAALKTGQTAIREASIGGAPVRILAAPIYTSLGPWVAVVIGDRSAEVGTLQALMAVLLGGGLLVLAASLIVGYVYAGRALVPIRESLRRQREFAADASHELRTPLTITRAAIAELGRGRNDPAVVERALSDLDAGTTRIEQLVGDLLLLARTDAEAVELVPVATDLAHLAAETTESMEPIAATRGIRLVLDVTPTPIRGDEVRLRQLVAILLDNAIRHSPPDGRVTVAVRPGATLAVEDQGPGLRSTDLERVFERFWRASDAPPGGTGLGLAIARWIADRHRGTITAGNREGGHGARFVVRLPTS